MVGTGHCLYNHLTCLSWTDLPDTYWNRKARFIRPLVILNTSIGKPLQTSKQSTILSRKRMCDPPCCPFHAGRLRSKTAPPRDTPVTVSGMGDNNSILQQQLSIPPTSSISARRHTDNFSPRHARTLSQRILHSSGSVVLDKTKKLFRTSSSGSSIDGAPAHPLTISSSSSNLALIKVIDPPENSSSTRTAHADINVLAVVARKGGERHGIIPRSFATAGASGTADTPSPASSSIHSSEAGRSEQHQSMGHGMYKAPLTRSATIDQPATAARMILASSSATSAPASSSQRGKNNLPPFNSSLAFWPAPFYQQQEQHQEIKSKLTTEGPGLNSGNIITKNELIQLSQEVAAAAGSGRSPVVTAEEALALASLSGILSANASSNGGTFLPQVPPYPPSSHPVSDHQTFFSSNSTRRSDSTLPGRSASEECNDSSAESGSSLAKNLDGPPAGSLSTMRRPLKLHPYSPMYHPASVPHLNSDNDAVKVLNTGDGYVYLNQYKLSNETLGHGTYSIVKLAYNTEDNTHYAMKILSKKKLIKKHRLTRKSGDPMSEAYREIAILKKLNHPNIIRLIEVLDDPSEDSLYMVFQLLERGEILVIPTDHPLHESTARRLFRDLILGVEYLHYNGILHRDLKPSNLLLDDNGRLKIADFGLSHMFEGTDDLLSSTVGTPAFHAPEVLSSTNANTTVRIAAASGSSPASRSGSLSRAGSDSDGEKLLANQRVLCSGVAMDIWSMGITLYSLVFGEVPFRDQFIVGLYNQIKFSSPYFPPDIIVSDQLQDLILRLLEKDPEKRISLVEMRTHPWVTQGGSNPLTPSVEDNCKVQIYVTEEDILASVRSIPHLDTLILIKAMLHRRSFHHPFKMGSEGSFKSDDNRKGSLDSNLQRLS